jgi:hypothetical protein
MHAERVEENNVCRDELEDKRFFAFTRHVAAIRRQLSKCESVSISLRWIFGAFGLTLFDLLTLKFWSSGLAFGGLYSILFCVPAYLWLRS